MTDTAKQQSRAPEKRASDRRFYNEIYWFLSIGLLACIVAIILLPPRASKSLTLLQRERQLHAGQDRVPRSKISCIFAKFHDIFAKFP